MTFKITLMVLIFVISQNSFAGNLIISSPGKIIRIHSSASVAPSTGTNSTTDPRFPKIGLAGVSEIHEQFKKSEQAPRVELTQGTLTAEEIDNMDYLKVATNNSLDMLIAASQKYKEGTITKDQYIEVAFYVSKMADYYRKVTLGTSTNAQNPQIISATSSTTPKNISNALRSCPSGSKVHDAFIANLNAERAISGLIPIWSPCDKRTPDEYARDTVKNIEEVNRQRMSEGKMPLPKPGSGIPMPAP